MAITNFRGQYWLLSNMAEARVEVAWGVFRSAEHAYQASKFQDQPGVLACIQAAATAFDVKKVGKQYTANPAFLTEEVQTRTMREILVAKFTQNAAARRVLLRTGTEEISHHTVSSSGKWWVDHLWGVDEEGVGKDMLGKLLMEIRATLLTPSSSPTKEPRKETGIEPLDVGRRSPWGSPVIMGMPCPVCGLTHTEAGETIPCFQQYLKMRLAFTPRFLEALEGRELYCPGCKGASPCHRDVLTHVLGGGTLPRALPGKVALTGARKTPQVWLDRMVELGALFARKGFWCASGNAQGADQAWGRGVNSVNPGKLQLFRPRQDGRNDAAVVEGNGWFFSREEHDRFLLPPAKAAHGAWDRVGQSFHSHFLRNVSIVIGAQLMVTYLDHSTSWGGGSGHGVRLAEAAGIRVIDLSKDDGEEKLAWLTAKLTEMEDR